ncbi:MAG: serine/threonine-protein phosphatase [Prevotella sp.]|nr:serine/threonine-protein phosphatase [Prevotella sp.]
MQQLRRAELYWKAAVEGDMRGDQNLKYYAKAANRLANLLLLKNDFEGTLRVALPTIEKMEALGGDSIGDFANLLTAVASCQLMLDMPDEAARNYRRAFVDYQKILEQNPSQAHFKSAIVCLITTTTNYLKANRFEDALQWAGFYEQMLDQYEEITANDEAYVDKQRARVGFYRATAYHGLGRTGEAADSYRQALYTKYAKTDDGLIEATEYLLIANRFREAANNFRVLDHQMAHYNLDMSMENIDKYLIPKFRANVGASRRDTIIAVAMQICDALDSAVIKAKQSDAAELATIYDTQRKEAQIAQQQADLTQQKLISTGIALILVILGFMVYTLVKRQAQHRLAAAHEKLEDAHQKLQTAYDQLESTTKAKERIESELRIARNIQQQMLPSVFPNREGLDLYGSMTPAKEVGGDLYDYLLQGDNLYFCLGDVSGKGVPAALFMAQAIRMFRTLAKQGNRPAEIATRLNDELTVGNDNGMFVTMFIGLLNLDSGHLYFCNAGHNPPIIGGNQQGTKTCHFLEMEPNAPIGLWEGLQYVGEEIECIRGRSLFVYSDGLNEAENRQQQQFGDDRLLNILLTTHIDSSRHIVETLNQAVEQHRDGATPNDDLTMLCLRVR